MLRGFSAISQGISSQDCFWGRYQPVFDLAQYSTCLFHVPSMTDFFFIPLSCLHKIPISLWRLKDQMAVSYYKTSYHQTNSSYYVYETLEQFHSTPVMALIYLALWWFSVDPYRKKKINSEINYFIKTEYLMRDSPGITALSRRF